MSTEHQRYSISNQSVALRDYASSHGLEIVRSYCDSGRSGLTLDGRPALRRLLLDVQSGAADYRAVLVLDVSRWGRFQDIDESAYYEFICRRSGIKVHYCAEQFENDASPISAIIKALKRAMAGEYSRELSQKVFAGQSRLARLGLYTGARPGLGFRRELRDETGTAKGILELGQRKNILSEHTVRVPGPPEEVEVVRWIFRVFATGEMHESQIARELNERGLVTTTGGPWSYDFVRTILTNERYTGVSVWNARSCKLKGRRRKNRPDQLIRVEEAFPPIIARSIFNQAQEVFARRAQERSREGKLQRLREFYRQHGNVTPQLLCKELGPATVWRYRHQFRSIMLAIEAAGIPPPKQLLGRWASKDFPPIRKRVITDIIGEIQRRGGSATFNGQQLCINDEFTVAVVLLPRLTKENGKVQWKRDIRTQRGADILVAVRMGCDHKSIQDYCIIPMREVQVAVLLFTPCSDRLLESYRFSDLSVLFDMAERSEVAAPP